MHNPFIRVLGAAKPGLHSNQQEEPWQDLKNGEYEGNGMDTVRIDFPKYRERHFVREETKDSAEVGSGRRRGNARKELPEHHRDRVRRGSSSTTCGL